MTGWTRNILFGLLGFLGLGMWLNVAQHLRESAGARENPYALTLELEDLQDQIHGLEKRVAQLEQLR